MRRAAVVSAMIVAIACASGGSPNEAPSAARPTSGLIGDWSWRRSCNAVVRALDDAGLEDVKVESLVEARYFARADQVAPHRPCRGAEETRYVYFFEASGRWGMLDDDDVLVDDREFAIVDGDTITFDGIEIDHQSEGGTLTFEVRQHEPCDSACLETYVWSVVTFAAATLRRAS